MVTKRVIEAIFFLPSSPSFCSLSRAGIATAISYFAVFALRALHSKKFMPFDLKALKLAFNTLAVVLQAVFMMCDLPGNVLVQVLMISLIFAVNGRSLVSAAMKILKKIIKK